MFIFNSHQIKNVFHIIFTEEWLWLKRNCRLTPWPQHFCIKNNGPPLMTCTKLFDPPFCACMKNHGPPHVCTSPPTPSNFWPVPNRSVCSSWFACYSGFRHWCVIVPGVPSEEREHWGCSCNMEKHIITLQCWWLDKILWCSDEHLRCWRNEISSPRELRRWGKQRGIG